MFSDTDLVLYFVSAVPREAGGGGGPSLLLQE